MKIIKVENCGECPWSYEELAGDGTITIDRCMGTDQIVEKESIPDWCPLEDEKLRYVAYNEIEGFKVIEEYDCPIHGKLGGIDECPLC
jgi:hypothetical protein